MKLYCTSDAYSQAPQIAFYEAGVEVDPVRVNLQSFVTADGQDFASISPLGQVPVLELNDGATIRELPAILLVAANLAPRNALTPACGTVENARLFEWLSFLSTELHQGLSQLARDGHCHPAEHRRARLRRRLAWIDVQLSVRPFLLPSGFSVADIYLWAVTEWVRSDWGGCDAMVGTELGALDHICAWHDNVARRPSVAIWRARGGRSLPPAS